MQPIPAQALVPGVDSPESRCPGEASLWRSLEGNTRGVGCVQSQAATHRTLYTAARPLANACLCEALGRQACGSFDFCTFLLKDNTAGLATALRGEQATVPAPAYTGGTCTAGRRSSSRVGRRGSRRRPCSPPVLNLVHAAVAGRECTDAASPSAGPRAPSTGPRSFDWPKRCQHPLILRNDS